MAVGQHNVNLRLGHASPGAGWETYKRPAHCLESKVRSVNKSRSAMNA